MVDFLQTTIETTQSKINIYKSAEKVLTINRLVVTYSHISHIIALMLFSIISIGMHVYE